MGLVLATICTEFLATESGGTVALSLRKTSASLRSLALNNVQDCETRLPANTRGQLLCPQQSQDWLGAEGSPGKYFTFGLYLLTVWRDDDTLQLSELQVFQDFPQPQDQSALGLSLDWIFLVHAVLETDQLFQQLSHTDVHFFTQHLATVAGRNTPGLCFCTALKLSAPCTTQGSQQ